LWVGGLCSAVLCAEARTNLKLVNQSINEPLPCFFL
jgi:hypothetical protein